MEVDETGITIRDALCETRWKWEAFIKKQENDTYYFLFSNSIEALIVPKRIFKIAEEKSRFEKLLAQHLSLDAEVGHMVKN